MATLANIDERVAFASELKHMVRASQEISIMRMEKIRSSALATRTYMEGVQDVFLDVRISKQRVIDKIIKREHKAYQKAEEFGKKSSVIVFVSTHEHFAGSIIPEVFEVFAKEVRKNLSDVVVVGSLGRTLLKREFGANFPFTYSDMSITNPQDDLLKALISKLLEYERIDLYAGRYFSLVDQRPVSINISGNASLLSERPERKDSQNRWFLFEPDLEQIISFFQTQITTALFRLSIDESKLANLGSRITTLESALENLEEEERKLERRKLILLHAKQNKKQQQRLAGLLAQS